LFQQAITYLILLFSLPIVKAESLTGRVVRVTHGDATVVPDSEKVQHKIHLQGIDAPERHKAFGTKSSEALFNLGAGNTVVVDYREYDRYQRILGKVIVSGDDVNLEVVEAGMVWYCRKNQREQSFSDRISIPTQKRCHNAQGRSLA
jgi:endonuclease YncB( thermonuclease family)